MTAITRQDQFTQLTRQITGGLAKSSAIQYQRAYRRWYDWTAQQDTHPLNLSPAAISAYIQQFDSYNTRKWNLTVLKKLLRVCAAISSQPRHRLWLALVNETVRVRPEDCPAQRKPKRVISADEIRRLITVWQNDHSPAGVRNHAIILTLAFTGIRNTPLTRMCWDHIDPASLTVFIPINKGGRDDTIRIYHPELVIPALNRLQEAQPSGYRHVFTRLTTEANAEFADDAPLKSDRVSQITREASEVAGIPRVHPHAFRRALLTQMSRAGIPPADIQNQANHASFATTANYIALSPNSHIRSINLLEASHD